MFISEIPDLPSGFVEVLQKKGYESLYPPQEDAVSSGVLDGKNLVLATPTASGKTLIAMMAAMRAIDRGGKVVYLAPLRALASEKYEEFKGIFEQLKRPGSRSKLRVFISTGDYDSSGESLGGGDVIILTNERFDSVVRHNASWINSVSLFIADEVHLVGDAHRGPTLEMILAKAMKFVPSAQIVALSATISNSKDLAEWLHAELVETNWRPVKLIEGIYDYGTISFIKGGQRRLTQSNRGAAIDVAIDSVKDGGQSLIFCDTRKRSVAAAEKAAEILPNFLSFEESGKLREIAHRIISSGEETDLSRRLADIVAKGAAFHHAGLDPKHRKIIEDAYKDREIKILTATPTLCLPPDQNIICYNEVKSIANLSTRERVLTHNGSYESTGGPVSRNFEGRLVVVHPYYQLPMSMTPEHQVLVARRTRHGTHTKSYVRHWWTYSAPVWVPAGELKSTDLVLFPRIKKIVDDESLSKDFLELCGLFVAEGSTSKTGTIIFDISTLEQKLTSSIRQKLEQLGLRSRFVDRERHRRRVYGCSRKWARYFKSQFGHSASEKRLPHLFIELPDTKMCALIKGLWSGDGTISLGKNATARYNTVSKQLAFQIFLILAKLGYIPTLSLVKPRGMGKHPMYVLEISGLQLDKFMQEILGMTSVHHGNRFFQLGHIDNNFLYLPIKKIESMPYSGPVYNLEVNEDSSYVGSFIVHNSAGVNLPARRVVLSSLFRYNYEEGGQTPISVMEFRQMAGRAGRPRYDKFGEIVLLAGSQISSQEIYEHYFEGKPEPIHSQLAADGPLRMHLLGLIASSQEQSEEEIYEFFESTLFGAQYNRITIKARVKQAIVYLEEEGLLARKMKKFRATDFGRRVALLYIDPESAIIMRRGIRESEKGGTHVLGILHLLTQTPDMTPKFGIRNKDQAELDEVLKSGKSELLIPLPSADSFEYYRDFDNVLGDFRTVLALTHWINENPEQSILEKYSIEPGDLHRMVDNADWLLYSFGELAQLYGRTDLIVESSELRERVVNGIKRELIPLTKLEGIGRVRARSLFAAGFTDIDKLSQATVEKLSKVPKIGPAVASQIKKQLP